MDKRFEEYCLREDEIDAGEALDILIDTYINACGVSLGERTVAFNAAFYWIWKFRRENPELPLNMNLKSVMELRSEEYRRYKEDIDKYGVCCMDPEELLRVCNLMLDDYEDEVPRIVLCRGILFLLKFVTEVEPDAD